MFERFTEKAIKVIMLAQEEARRLGHNFVGTEQILLGLIGEGTGVAAKVLKSMGVNLKDARVEVEKIIGRGSGFVAVEIPFTPRAKRVLELSLEEARQLGHNYIGTEHLLLGLIREGEGVAARVLENLGVDLAKVRTQVIRMLGETAEVSAGGGGGGAKGSTKTPTLDEFGNNLTQLATEAKLDPVVGRHNEIDRVIQILGRRTKNNPVLIGEPGVGKTAIAEGLAQRIQQGDIPDILEDKRVLTLDIGLLVAGTKYRGEFEERLKKIMEEIKAAGNVILVIDEVHTLIGAGAAEGAIDAANILKPALARGELQCIGATTLDEYRKHIERDAALERRFQPVNVGEPSIDDTIEILRGLRERYEQHHRLKITDDALVAAATLGDRYISDRFLPDKAIDLVDESAARLKMEITSKPEEIDEIDRKILQLEMEKLSLGRESDSASQERLQRIERELAELGEQQSSLNAQWQQEKGAIDELSSLKEEIERVQLQVEQAKRSYDLNKAAELEYGTLASLQKQLLEQEAQIASEEPGEKGLLREEVSEDDIAEVIAKWTGIPVARLVQSEMEKLLQLEDDLHQRVIGQHQAVTAVADAIQRSRAGLSDPNRPIASFLFLGPTGVGKTELSKALANRLFDSDDAMVRIDMSEYMEKHTVSRLIGAPPGYVGYEAGGQLTEAVRRRPYAVILFDEVEKAHPDVFNVMLQILDDGRVTDGQGRTVDFTNTVLILTSNIGSQSILELAGDPEQHGAMESRVNDALRAHFRPEFLNRLDDQIIFHSLRREELRQIVTLQVERLRQRLAERKLELSLSDGAADWLANAGYDPVYGARPLKRAVQRELETPIAKAILAGRYSEGQAISVELEADALALR